MSSPTLSTSTNSSLICFLRYCNSKFLHGFFFRFLSIRENYHEEKSTHIGDITVEVMVKARSCKLLYRQMWMKSWQLYVGFFCTWCNGREQKFIDFHFMEEALFMEIKISDWNLIAKIAWRFDGYTFEVVSHLLKASIKMNTIKMRICLNERCGR